MVNNFPTGDNKVSVWKQELNGVWAPVSDMSERD